MTKRRELGNKAMEVVSAMHTDLLRQEQMVFDIMGKMALDERAEMILILGRLRERQRRLQDCAMRLLRSDFDEALEALRMDED